MGNELMHYGVKGMHWGVINDIEKPTGVLLDNLFNLKESKATAQRKKAVASMTEDELRKRVTRLNLEKQYSTLTQGSITAGRDRLNRILSLVGSTAALGLSALTIAERLRGSVY